MDNEILKEFSSLENERKLKEVNIKIHNKKLIKELKKVGIEKVLEKPKKINIIILFFMYLKAIYNKKLR